MKFWISDEMEAACCENPMAKFLGFSEKIVDDDFFSIAFRALLCSGHTNFSRRVVLEGSRGLQEPHLATLGPRVAHIIPIDPANATIGYACDACDACNACDALGTMQTSGCSHCSDSLPARRKTSANCAQCSPAAQRTGPVGPKAGK